MKSEGKDHVVQTTDPPLLSEMGDLPKLLSE